MAAKKQTNLSLTKVKSVSKSLDKTEVYEITEGQYAGSQITFYPLFSSLKIDELITEFQLLIQEASEKKLELEEKTFITLIQFLTIKHFTHFKKDIPSTLLGEGKKEGILDWLNHFAKTGLFEIIIDEVFLPSEIQKVMNSIIDYTAKGVVYTDLEQQMQDKVSNLKFKYKDVFEQVGKIGQNDVRNVLADPVN